MRNHEIEALALNIIDRVVSGQPVEDSRVELKTEWIDPKKAARRIAGHANASHGEPALWLIGVDEKQKSVPGVPAAEFSNWYAQVASCFDELAPSVTDLAIPYAAASVTVVALLFQTDRAPYLVKNQDGGGIAREVPFRHGTRVDTATRSQLIRLLSPAAAMARFEIVHSILKANVDQSFLRFQLFAKLLILQPQNQESYIAAHRIRVTITDSEGLDFRLQRLVLKNESQAQFYSESKSVTLLGPASFFLEAYNSYHVPPAEMPQGTPITATFSIWPVNAESRVDVAVKMPWRTSENPTSNEWWADFEESAP